METGLPEVNASGWPARLLRWASAPLLALGLALAWDGASAPAPAFRLGVSDESGWLWQAVFREAGAAATDATGLAPQSLWRIDGLSLTLRHAPGAWQSPRALRQAQLAGELDGWLALPADPLGRLGTAPPAAILHSVHPDAAALAVALGDRLSAQVSAQRRAEAQLPEATIRWAQAPLAVHLSGAKPPPPQARRAGGLAMTGLLLALLLQLGPPGRQPLGRALAAPLWRTGLWGTFALSTFYALRLTLAPNHPLPLPPAPPLTQPEALVLAGAGLLTYALYGALHALRRPGTASPRALGLTLLGLGSIFVLAPAPLLTQLGEIFLWCPPLAVFGIMAMDPSAEAFPKVLGPLALLGMTTLALCISAQRALRSERP